MAVAPGDIAALFGGVGAGFLGVLFLGFQVQVGLENSVVLVEDGIEAVFVEGDGEQVGEEALVLLVHLHAVLLAELFVLGEEAVPLLPGVAGVGQGDLLHPGADHLAEAVRGAKLVGKFVDGRHVGHPFWFLFLRSLFPSGRCLGGAGPF